jgi:hypothetical protein
LQGFGVFRTLALGDSASDNFLFFDALVDLGEIICVLWSMVLNGKRAKEKKV